MSGYRTKAKIRAHRIVLHREKEKRAHRFALSKQRKHPGKAERRHEYLSRAHDLALTTAKRIGAQLS